LLAALNGNEQRQVVCNAGAIIGAGQFCALARAMQGQTCIKVLGKPGIMLRVMQFLPGVQDVDKSILMVPGRNRDSAPGYGRIKSGLLGPPTKWTTLSTCWE